MKSRCNAVIPIASIPPGKRVYVKSVPRVRIPPHPSAPLNVTTLGGALLFAGNRPLLSVPAVRGPRPARRTQEYLTNSLDAATVTTGQSVAHRRLVGALVDR